MNLSRTIRESMAGGPPAGEMAAKALAVFRERLAESIQRNPPPNAVREPQANTDRIRTSTGGPQFLSKRGDT